jgi:pSer/pThr/pTyr-binding forkhead associated (FHA) protein
MVESVFLRVENDDGVVDFVSFGQAEQRLVGRDADCAWRSSSLFVSRRHCVFDIDPPFVSVRDLQSLNGTYVNGQRIEGELRLTFGDVVKVGSMIWEVREGLDFGAYLNQDQREADLAKV